MKTRTNNLTIIEGCIKVFFRKKKGERSQLVSEKVLKTTWGFHEQHVTPWHGQICSVGKIVNLHVPNKSPSLCVF